MNIILLVIYLFALIVIFGFISIVVMHIGDFRQYSKYLSVVLKLYLIAVILIGVFGAYMIATNKVVSVKKVNSSVQRINF